MDYTALGRYTDLRKKIIKLHRERGDKRDELDRAVQMLEAGGTTGWCDYKLAPIEQIVGELGVLNRQLMVLIHEANTYADAAQEPRFDIVRPPD